MSSNPQEPFKRISAQEAKELIDRGDVQIIDVRQPGEWMTGHVEGAVLIPVDSLFERVAEIEEDKDVLFYCAVGVRSALACEIGAAMDRTRCHNLEGGMDAWKAGSLPFVMPEAAPNS
jgi:hydroxyacylglutathione hydrolase